ncbi:MAG TPA: hypothetical protein VMA95_19945 [Streptosporangiaceae bacterium]|nr:hypothetical protein [Streptosporangiaceae bacterium]
MDNGRTVLDGAIASGRDPASAPRLDQPPHHHAENESPRRSGFRRVVRATVITILILLIAFILGLIAGAASGAL